MCDRRVDIVSSGAIGIDIVIFIFSRSHASEISRKHVCEDIFGLLESLGHLHVVGLQRTRERVGGAQPLLVHLGDHPGLAGENDLCLVLEVHLHDLVGEAQHDGVLGPHPLLDLDGSALVVLILGLVDLGVLTIQLGAEVLQESHFLLQLFGLVLEGVRTDHVLPVRCSPLHLLEVAAIGIQDYLGRVVEEHSASAVGQQIPQSILAALVNPLPDPHVRPFLDGRASLAFL